MSTEHWVALAGCVVVICVAVGAIIRLVQQEISDWRER